MNFDLQPGDLWPDEPLVRQFRGRKRLLVVSGASPSWLENARERAAMLRDYDLELLEAPAEDGHAFRAVLVGKDGTLKAIYGADFEWDAVFGLIDTMPMRQQEVARRRRD